MAAIHDKPIIEQLKMHHKSETAGVCSRAIKEIERLSSGLTDRQTVLNEIHDRLSKIDWSFPDKSLAFKAVTEALDLVKQVVPDNQSKPRLWIRTPSSDGEWWYAGGPNSEHAANCVMNLLMGDIAEMLKGNQGSGEIEFDVRVMTDDEVAAIPEG